jgi:hypothetical protein
MAHLEERPILIDPLEGVQGVTWTRGFRPNGSDLFEFVDCWYGIGAFFWEDECGRGKLVPLLGR